MKRPPEIKIPLLKYMLESVDHPIELRTKIFDTYGDIARKTLIGEKTYYFRHPKAIEHILETHQDNYPNKHKRLITTFAHFIGFESIFIQTQMSRWYHDRMIAKMSFEESVYFKQYSKAIVSLCNKMLDQWDREFKDGDIIDIPREIDKLLIEIVVHTLFTEFDLLNPSELAKTAPEIVEQAKVKLRLVHPAFFFFSPTRKKYMESIAYVRNLSKGIVAARLEEKLEENREWDDMLGNFIRDYKTRYTKEEMIETLSYHVTTFLVVGYFTTASLLHWSLVVHSLHPHLPLEILREYEKVIGDRDPGYEDVQSLPYLSATIKETLRMYPSSFAILRQSLGDDEIDGYFISKDSGIVLSVAHVHRHPDFWENPDGFDPTRFLKNPLGQENRFAYIPFGAGRRNCIASAFATMEATLIIPMILRRFSISLLPFSDTSPFVTSLLTNRPTVNLMRIKKRK